MAFKSASYEDTFEKVKESEDMKAQTRFNWMEPVPISRSTSNWKLLLTSSAWQKFARSTRNKSLFPCTLILL